MLNETGRPYRVPLVNRILRVLMKPVFQGLFHILADIHLFGRGNVPFGRPYLVAINHVSTFDPPFLLAFWPEMIEAMGASDIWSRPGQAQLVRMYHAIQVHRGEYDREVFSQVINVIRAGKPLLLAPEGGRSHVIAMRRAQPGISYLVEKTQVPVLPVGITGTTDDFFTRASRGERPTLEMHIGKPLILPQVSGKGLDRRLIRQQNADLVMAHIAGLLPEEYRGYYAAEAISPEQ